MTEPAPTRELLTYFDACHRVKLGVPAVVSAQKDAALLAVLWRQYPDQVRPLIARFFAERGTFAEQAGYTVGVFRSQFARLLVQWVKDERRSVAMDHDWWTECQQVHEGRCNGQYAHDAMMAPPKDDPS
jgi:hypothetical protein